MGFRAKGCGRKEPPFTVIEDKAVNASFDGFNYVITCEKGHIRKPESGSDYVFRDVSVGSGNSNRLYKCEKVNEYISLEKMGDRWMVSVLSGFQLRAADPVVVPANTEPLTIEGNRFVTLCIMIRTTPWEVSGMSSCIPWMSGLAYLEGVRALWEAFATNNPNGRLTWGFTMNALEDGRKNYQGDP